MNRIYTLGTDSKGNTFMGPLCPQDSLSKISLCARTTGTGGGVTVPLRARRLESFLVVTMQERGGTTGAKTRDAAKHPTMRRTAPNTRLSGPNANSARAEESAVLNSPKHRVSTYCVQGCTAISQGDGVTGLHIT